MKRNAHILRALVLVTLAACDARPDPVGPEAPTIRAAAEPLLIESGTFFAVEPIDFPVDEAAGAQVITNSGQIAGVMAFGGGVFGEYVLDRATGILTEIPKERATGIIHFPKMNDVGTAVGSAPCEGTTCAYRWTAAGLELLRAGRTGALAYAAAAGANDANVVAGFARNADFALAATRWDADGTPEFLHDEQSFASDINDRGEILVNVSQTSSVTSKVDPHIWTPTGGLRRLTEVEAAVATVAGGAASVLEVAVHEISDRGDIVGTWQGSDETRYGFYYGADGAFHDFSSLGRTRSIQHNDLGEVGLTTIPDPLDDARVLYFWSPSAGLIELPLLEGAGTTSLNDINNEAEMVGASAGMVVIWRPLTSADDALDELVETLDDVLAGGGVDVEGGNGLEVKLNSIRDHLEAGRANAARNQLDAFVNQVEAMIADGRLSADDGAAPAGRRRGARGISHLTNGTDSADRLSALDPFAR
jgi:hypothetical protein